MGKPKTGRSHTHWEKRDGQTHIQKGEPHFCAHFPTLAHEVLHRDHLGMRKGRRVHRQLVTQFGSSGQQWWLHFLYRSLSEEETSQQQQTMQGKNVLQQQQEEQHSVVVFFRSVAESTSRRRHCCQPTKRRTLRVLIRANYSREQLHLADPSLVATKTRGHTHTERKLFFPTTKSGTTIFSSIPKFQQSDAIKETKKKQKKKWKSFSLKKKYFFKQDDEKKKKSKIPRLGRSDREVEGLFESERPKISRPRPDVATSPV